MQNYIELTNNKIDTLLNHFLKNLWDHVKIIKTLKNKFLKQNLQGTSTSNGIVTEFNNIESLQKSFFKYLYPIGRTERKIHKICISWNQKNMFTGFSSSFTFINFVLQYKDTFVKKASSVYYNFCG